MHPLGGQAQGVRLEQGAQFIVLTRDVEAVGHHLDTLVGHVLDQAVGLQPAEGLPNRGRADAKALG